MGTVENKEIVRRAFDAFMVGDLTPLRDLLAPDATLHQCGFLEPILAQAILEGEFPAFRAVRAREGRLEQIVAEGDLVALHWRTTGEWAHPGSPELEGTPVSFPSMSFVRLDAGKIAEIWNIQDRSTLDSQLHEAAEEKGLPSRG